MGLNEEVREAGLLIYGRGCPNCRGYINDRRLKIRVPCTSCLTIVPKKRDIRTIYRLLKNVGRIKRFKEVYDVEHKVSKLRDFFRKCVGNDPWSIQIMWMKRIAKDTSFAMIAPTGVGKTTFGLVVALYLALEEGQKSYLIVPTTTLAMQIENKISEFSSRFGETGILTRCLVIHSKLPKKEKESRERRLEDPDGFDILVTTSNYLIRNYQKVLKHDFRFIFVDDVDAVLRGSKAINYILHMAGFDEHDIEIGIKILRLKKELAARGEADKRLLMEINKLTSILERKRRRNKKIVIISSATGNPRGMRVRLFRELLGFEIGARPEFIRNIIDTYDLLNEKLEDKVAELVKSLGKGGIIYVPIDKGIEYAEKLAKDLNSRGVRSEAIHSKNIKAIEAFIAGDIDVLVGVATYYGVLVRGIDLPETIRYAIFTGVPRHKIGLRLTEARPLDILRLLPLVRDAVDDKDMRTQLDRYIVRLRRYLRRVGTGIIERLAEVLQGVRKPEFSIEEEFLNAFTLLKRLLSDARIIAAIKSNPDIAVVEENGELYVLIPDAPTYIQASGRTSRLYLGGISKGLSILLVDDERLLRGLEKKLRWIIEEFSFKPLNQVNINEVLREIDNDRTTIKLVRKGKIPKHIKGIKPLELKTALLVVESPNKARTIAKFFGRPSVREYGKLKVYEANLGNYTLLITASGGHIYDLVTDLTSYPNIYGVALLSEGNLVHFIPIYTTLKRCLDCGHQFTRETSKCPICGSINIKDSLEVVDAIRDVALEVDEILIGTDPDTEGEKIAYDLANLVRPYTKAVKRIEFHEVTRRAITKALSNPRDIDIDLVKAQVVRRIEDRWLGFSLSRLLQTEFWQEYCRTHAKKDQRCRDNPNENRNLSAGRVQTPVLGWIIQSYEDYVKSRKKYIIVRIDGHRLEVGISKELEKKIGITKANIEEVRLKIKDISIKEERLNPLPPYTTDTVLSDLNTILGMSAAEAMNILQELFELGFITYHRTDSTRVSEVGIAVAKEYMKETLGNRFKDYFAPKYWGTEGAHECIRPTRPVDAQTLQKLINEGIIEPVRRLRRIHFAVYDLIFRRFIASQSKPAIVKKQVAKASIEAIIKGGRTVSLGEINIESYIEPVFDGFMKFYRYVAFSEPLKSGLYVFRKDEFEVREKSEKPLLTQANVIKLMKEKGIGRPSTYAKIVETLFKRGYVTLERKWKKGIIPVSLGKMVYEYLNSRYSDLVSEERTRELEEKMKWVEEGKVKYDELIKELHKELSLYNLIPGDK
jgi:reverse gyrase